MAEAKRNVARLQEAMPAFADVLHFAWREDGQRFAADWGGLRVAVGWGDFELFMFDRHGALHWDARFSASAPTSLVALVITKALEE